MPVNSTDLDYDAAATEWSRARDVQAMARGGAVPRAVSPPQAARIVAEFG